MANHIFRPVADWVVRNKADIARYGWPVFVFETFNWTFDHLAFPGGMATWGVFYGPLLITATALLLNALVFLAYDVMKIDWLQAKYLRDKADSDTRSQFERVLTAHRQAHTTRGEKVRAIRNFIALTAVVDPVILAVHYRENYFGGVSVRDWGILVAATLSACIIWVGLWEVVAMVFHLGHLGLNYLLALTH